MLPYKDVMTSHQEKWTAHQEKMTSYHKFAQHKTAQAFHS